jgi:predicted nucleotidyltransferase
LDRLTPADHRRSGTGYATRGAGESEAILHICAKRGARNVRVFGSVARSEADEQSDIELIVEFDPERSLLDHAALWLELQDLLWYKLDVVSARGIKPRIRERVLREAIPLCEIRKNAFETSSILSPGSSVTPPEAEKLLRRTN